jgi:cytochrome c oxidase subunit 4
MNEPSPPETPHIIAYSTYVKVWAALVVLTLTTVGASLVTLRHLAVFTAILIASVKACLVVLYFMHIRFERKIFAGMLVFAVGTYAIFLILTFADYSFR